MNTRDNILEKPNIENVYSYKEYQNGKLTDEKKIKLSRLSHFKDYKFDIMGDDKTQMFIAANAWKRERTYHITPTVLLTIRIEKLN